MAGREPAQGRLGPTMEIAIRAAVRTAASIARLSPLHMPVGLARSRRKTEDHSVAGALPARVLARFLTERFLPAAVTCFFSAWFSAVERLAAFRAAGACWASSCSTWRLFNFRTIASFSMDA